MRKFFVAVVIWACASACVAQTNASGIFMKAATENDVIGNRLVYAVKEGIRRSNGLKYVEQEKDSLIGLQIVTMQLKNGRDVANSTVYSISVTTRTLGANPVTMFLDSYVGVCGTEKVTECADGIVAIADQKASMVRGWLQSILTEQK